MRNFLNNVSKHLDNSCKGGSDLFLLQHLDADGASQNKLKLVWFQSSKIDPNLDIDATKTKVRRKTNLGNQAYSQNANSRSSTQITSPSRPGKRTKNIEKLIKM